MMDTSAFLADLSSRGIILTASGDQLVCDAPKGALTPELADAIRSRKPELLKWFSEAQSGKLSAVPLRTRDRGLRMGIVQQRMWLHSMLEPETVLYHLPAAWRFSGALDRRALEAAFSGFVARHEILRATIDSSGDAPLLEFSEPQTVRLPVLDLRGLPEAEREREMHRVLEAARDEPFDLAAGPLYRARLVILGDRDHVLFMMPHHVVWDGWSFDLFLRDLSELYAANRENRAPELPELPIQYADYAMWHRDWLEGGQMDRDIEYWTAQLSGALPVLEIPTDKPRPAYFSHKGQWATFDIDALLTSELRSLGREHSASLFMILLAVWKVFLLRYTGQSDLVVGAPIQARSLPETEDLIGAFVNTLVLRTSVDEDATFRELLLSVRDTCLDAYAHQEVPIEVLIDRLMTERSTSHTPLFQVMFSHQQVTRRPTHFGNLEVSQVHVNPAATATDLIFAVMEGTHTVRAVLNYSTDLFDAPTIERACGHLLSLSKAAVANPDTPISAMPLLSSVEEHQLLDEFNDTEMKVPAVCLHHLVEEQARRSPARVAARDGRGELSYGELNASANRLANHLVALGVRAGSLVGVSLHRNTDLLVALLAILKAGGAYLPLDAEFPEERLAYMLEDSGAPVLVTNSELLDDLPEFSGRAVCIDAERVAIGAHPSEAPRVEVSPDDLAYVIYTSGSTGEPKGVEVCHSNVVNFLSTMAQRPGLFEDDVLLAVTTLSFDISVLELFGPLSVGAQVVIADSEATADGEELRDLLERSGINLMQATPSVWRMLFDAGWAGHNDLRVLVGGEALPADLARQLATASRATWNMYGPTETTIWSACWQVPADDSPVRIGTPIGNTQLYVLDRLLQPVPLGVPGELYIGGAGVARGYRNQPELTSRAFVPDPFSGVRGARLYRTGDLVRLRNDFSLEYVRRMDHQVKVRGYRIELGEIETALERHEAIKEAVAGVSDAGSLDARLVAYVVFEEGKNLTPSEVRRFLRSKVPNYMIPGIVMELDALPLTPNGKVDRKVLPDPLASPSGQPLEFVPPETATELTIARVWAELLNFEKVGRQDNFFEIGGHSLLAIRAAVAIKERTGRTLDPRTMFFQTVEQIARHLDAPA